ncbi:MAG: thiamine-binding protein [Actinomycetota bacterium]
MEVTAEFTVYPFREAEAPPRRVQAAIDEFRRAGLSVEVGLLGQVVRGEADVVIEALRAAQAAALSAGATKVVVSLEVRS